VYCGQVRTAAPCRVLVVNDDRKLAECVRGLLSGEGYEARVAFDGADALEAFTEWPADLILLDLLMPRLDGWGFLEQRHRNPALKRTPVLVWSVAETDELERARSFGATDCLSRAESPDRLLDSVARLIAQTPA
jgi:two-component system, chemotaxis family, chemotaxis protein CheY